MSGKLLIHRAQMISCLFVQVLLFAVHCVLFTLAIGKTTLVCESPDQKNVKNCNCSVEGTTFPTAIDLCPLDKHFCLVIGKTSHDVPRQTSTQIVPSSINVWVPRLYWWYALFFVFVFFVFTHLFINIFPGWHIRTRNSIRLSKVDNHKCGSCARKDVWEISKWALYRA